MLQRVRHYSSRPQGETIESVRANEVLTFLPEAERAAAFAEMHRVTRRGGRMLVAGFRPSRPHLFVSDQMRHNNVELLEDLADAAGFRIGTRSDLPRLRYVVAVRPDGR